MSDETEPMTNSSEEEGEDVYRKIWGDEPEAIRGRRRARKDIWEKPAKAPAQPVPSQRRAIRSPDPPTPAGERDQADLHFGLTGRRVLIAVVVAVALGLASAYEFASVASTGSMTVPSPGRIGDRVFIDLVDMMLGAGVGIASLGLLMIVLRTRR